MKQATSHRMTYQGRASFRVDPLEQKKVALEKRIMSAERNCTMLARKADPKSIDAFIDWSLRLYNMREQRKAMK